MYVYVYISEIVRTCAEGGLVVVIIFNNVLNVVLCFLLSLDLNMELPQGQTGSVGTSVASAEQVIITDLNCCK